MLCGFYYLHIHQNSTFYGLISAQKLHSLDPPLSKGGTSLGDFYLVYIWQFFWVLFDKIYENEISSFPTSSSAVRAQLSIEFQTVQIVQQRGIPGVWEALFAVCFDGSQLLGPAEGAGFLLPEPGDDTLPVEDMATLQLQGYPALETNAAALPQVWSMVNFGPASFHEYCWWLHDLNGSDICVVKMLRGRELGTLYSRQHLQLQLQWQQQGVHLFRQQWSYPLECL